MSSGERVESECFETWREGGLTVQKIKRYATVDAAAARVSLENIATVNQGGRYPLMVDIREPASISAEARALYAGEDAAHLSTRVALLQGSTVTAIAGNLFVKLNRPPVETKIFTSEDAAREWLFR
ncbi:MAG: STAS/SEC14 domain-containing protein [Myxococcota bacterium]